MFRQHSSDRCPSPGRALLRVSAVLLALAGLGACTYPQYPFMTDARSAPSMDPYRVDTVRINHDIAFLQGSATLDPIARANLQSFVSQVGVRPDDAITIVASGPFALARENSVAGALADLGIESVTMADGNVGFDQVTVSLNRTHYLATACLRGGVPHFNPGVLMPPPGCSVATNLAEMLERRDDLLVGRPAGSTDGVTGVRAVNRYRTGTTVELQSLGTN